MKKRRKFLTLLGLELVHPVASRYTYCTIPALVDDGVSDFKLVLDDVNVCLPSTSSHDDRGLGNA
jgi:hypothetical protein